MLNDKKLEELREQTNIAVIIVSSDAQDVARQRSEFQRIEQTLRLQFEYVELKNRKRTQLDRAALDILGVKTKLHGDINQWRHDCSRYGTADTWERTKIAIKDKRKTGELVARIRCFVLSPMPYEITDPTMDMQTKMLFQISTEEMKCLSKRILGAKRGQCLSGQHSGGDIPFPCDVVRSINGVETLRIHQLRSTSSNRRKPDPRPKYELIFPNGGSKICQGTAEDPLPKLKAGEKQHYVLTKDKKRVDLIKYLHRLCLDKDVPVIWNKLAKEVNQKYGDTFGNGWVGGRVKSLMLNTAIMGKPSIGKTSHADLPSLIIRSKDSPDGYEHNEEEVSGFLPEDSWVVPENQFFELISEDDFKKLKNKIFMWDAVREDDLQQANAARRKHGISPVKFQRNSNKYLRGLIWDVVDDAAMRVTNKGVLCPIRQDSSKGKQEKGCGVGLAMKPLERVLKDYLYLPAWEQIQTEKVSINSVSGQKMQDLVEEYISLEERAELSSEGNQFERMYELAMERADGDNREQLKQLNKMISNLTYAIETCDNIKEIPALRARLSEREKEKTELEERLAQSLSSDYLRDKEQLSTLALAIHRFCHDKIDPWQLRDLFVLHGIQILVDKAQSDGNYITIKSLKNPELPVLQVTYQMWRKVYVGKSLAERPQVFKKGHKFHPKKIALTGVA